VFDLVGILDQCIKISFVEIYIEAVESSPEGAQHFLRPGEALVFPASRATLVRTASQGVALRLRLLALLTTESGLPQGWRVCANAAANFLHHYAAPAGDRAIPFGDLSGSSEVSRLHLSLCNGEGE